MLRETQFQWTADAGLNAIAERVVKDHRPLAHKRANVYARHYNLPFEELRAAAYCGLMRAATRFDPERGFSFGTYSRYWIDYELREVARNSRNVVRRPRKLMPDEKEWDGPDSSLNTPIEKDHDSGEDSKDEVGDTIGCDPFGQMLCPSDQETRLHRVEEILIEHLDGQSESARRRDLLGEALTILTDRERSIVEARHGTGDPATQADLARRFNLTPQRIQQIEAKAIQKLQAYVADRKRFLANDTPRGQRAPRNVAKWRAAEVRQMRPSRDENDNRTRLSTSTAFGLVTGPDRSGFAAKLDASTKLPGPLHRRTTAEYAAAGFAWAVRALGAKIQPLRNGAPA